MLWSNGSKNLNYSCLKVFVIYWMSLSINTCYSKTIRISIFLRCPRFLNKKKIAVEQWKKKEIKPKLGMLRLQFLMFRFKKHKNGFNARHLTASVQSRATTSQLHFKGHQTGSRIPSEVCLLLFALKTHYLTEHWWRWWLGPGYLGHSLACQRVQNTSQVHPSLFPSQIRPTK